MITRLEVVKFLASLRGGFGIKLKFHFLQIIRLIEKLKIIDMFPFIF